MVQKCMKNFNFCGKSFKKFSFKAQKHKEMLKSECIKPLQSQIELSATSLFGCKDAKNNLAVLLYGRSFHLNGSCIWRAKICYKINSSLFSLRFLSGKRTEVMLA